jgi:hypothetical protein
MTVHLTPYRMFASHTASMPPWLEPSKYRRHPGIHSPIRGTRPERHLCTPIKSSSHGICLFWLFPSLRVQGIPRPAIVRLPPFNAHSPATYRHAMAAAVPAG